MGKHLGWGHEKGAEWPDRRPDKRTDLASWPDKQTTRRPLPLTFGKRPEGKGKHCRQGALFHRAPPLSKACSEKAPALKKAAGFVNGSGTLMPGQTGNLRSSLRCGCRQGPVMRAAEETGKRRGRDGEESRKLPGEQGSRQGRDLLDKRPAFLRQGAGKSARTAWEIFPLALPCHCSFSNKEESLVSC